MLWIWIVVTALVVVAIALGTVGSVSASLESRPFRAFYDVDEAVDYIADHLPAAVTARLSYEDVRFVVENRLRAMERLGLASVKVDDVGPGALVVVADDEVLAGVLAVAEAEERDIADADVAAVFLVDDEYQRHIGAVQAPDGSPDAQTQKG